MASAIARSTKVAAGFSRTLFATSSAFSGLSPTDSEVVSFRLSRMESAFCFVALMSSASLAASSACRLAAFALSLASFSISRNLLKPTIPAMAIIIPAMARITPNAVSRTATASSHQSTNLLRPRRISFLSSLSSFWSSMKRRSISTTAASSGARWVVGGGRRSGSAIPVSGFAAGSPSFWAASRSAAPATAAVETRIATSRSIPRERILMLQPPSALRLCETQTAQAVSGDAWR